MKVKTGFNLLTILTLLAFGPKENRDYLFRVTPERLYGEAEIFHRNAESLWVARNVSDDKVELLETSTVDVWSEDLASGSPYYSSSDKLIYAESMAIIRRTGTLDTTPNVRIGKVQPQRAHGLRVITEAEEFYQLTWPAILLTLTVVLTYLINDYSWECGSPIRDIVEGAEVP